MPWPVTIDNWTIIQGETVEVIYAVLDDSENAVDLTGFTVRCQFREFIADEDVLFSPTVQIESPETDGRILLTMTPAECAAITVPQFYFDIEVVSSGGAVTRVVKGRVTVDLEVTRD